MSAAAKVMDTPAQQAREGHAVLHVAMGTRWPAEGPGLLAVAGAVIAVQGALEVYAELDSDGLHWENVYPHLSGEADPDTEALRKAAEEVEAATGDLVKALAANCGTEAEMANATGGVR